MKEENKKILSIPDWFDLRKYEIGKDSPLIDWVLNLTVRKGYGHKFFAFDDKRNHKYHMDDYELIKEHGFLSRSLVQGIYELALHDFNLIEMKPGLGLVYPLSLSRAVEICQYIKGDEDEYRFNEEEYDNYFGDYGSFSPHICVDLGAPDETIIDAFRDWLKSVRNDEWYEGAHLPEKVSSKLIQRWESQAILPYLDLLIYQRVEGGTLPAHVIGDAIFPATADFDTTEAVRKTTRPNANRALMETHGIMRHALIVDEMQKVGKKNG